MRLLSQLRKSSSRSWHSFQVNVGLEVFCLFCVLKIWEWTSDKMLIPIQIRLVIYFYWINHTFIEVFPFFFFEQSFLLWATTFEAWSPFRKVFLWTCNIFVFCIKAHFIKLPTIGYFESSTKIAAFILSYKFERITLYRISFSKQHFCFWHEIILQY